MGAMPATLWSVRTGRDRLDGQTRRPSGSRRWSRPARLTRPLIMGHLVRLYLPALGIEPEPGGHYHRAAYLPALRAG
jgi:hypothetical protein